MVRSKSSGKRFGTRYGKNLRERVGDIDKKKRKLYKCPHCNKTKIKRLFIGIWQCKNCKTKFAGKAYSFKE